MLIKVINAMQFLCNSIIFCLSCTDDVTGENDCQEPPPPGLEQEKVEEMQSLAGNTANQEEQTQPEGRTEIEEESVVENDGEAMEVRVII